jgi:hypothetical protein
MEDEFFSDMLMFHVEHWHMVEKRVMEVGCVMHLKVRKMNYLLLLI